MPSHQPDLNPRHTHNKQVHYNFKRRYIESNNFEIKLKMKVSLPIPKYLSGLRAPKQKDLHATGTILRRRKDNTTQCKEKGLQYYIITMPTVTLIQLLIEVEHVITNTIH